VKSLTRGLTCLALALLVSAGVAHAQILTIRAWDGSAPVNVGNAADSSLRVHIIASDVSSAGGTSSADNGTYTAGTTSGTPLMGALDDTATTAATEDKVAIARITAQRALHINLRSAAGTELGVAAAPLQVSLANTAANGTAVKVDGTGGAFPVSGTLSTKPVDACGTTAYDAAALLSATTLTTVTATTTCVDTMVVANTGASNATILVEDGQGTPVVLANAVQIPVNGWPQPLPLAGVKFTSGIKLQANTANTLTYWIRGRQ
jgi:hypothetical protein